MSSGTCSPKAARLLWSLTKSSPRLSRNGSSQPSPALFADLEPPASERLTFASVSYQDSDCHDRTFFGYDFGTTSGIPKLIPLTHGWLKSFIVVKFAHILRNAGSFSDNMLGSLAHVGSFTCLLRRCTTEYALFRHRR
ncbi:hypothetical protein C8J56DRAFT_1053433 [Mycena floridula]|nr:hypothetical protein C8J56DRAFT_1053433 [Mycena floridula]